MKNLTNEQHDVVAGLSRQERLNVCALACTGKTTTPRRLPNFIQRSENALRQLPRPKGRSL